MTLLEEIQLRIKVYGGNRAVVAFITEEWASPKKRNNIYRSDKWTDKEIAFVHKRVNAIAKVLGRTPYAIGSKMYVMGQNSGCKK